MQSSHKTAIRQKKFCCRLAGSPPRAAAAIYVFCPANETARVNLRLERLVSPEPDGWPKKSCTVSISGLLCSARFGVFFELAGKFR